MSIRLIALTLAALAAPLAHAQPQIFMTSVTGNGNLSSWPDAGTAQGLQAADAICSARATAAGLENAGEYIAWLSDANDDAYCRVHGLGGKRADRCGMLELPATAGPWYRRDGLAAFDIAANAFTAYPQAQYLPRHVLYDEFGQALPADSPFDSLAFGSSASDGTALLPQFTCDNWTSSNPESEVWLINAYRAGSSWSAFGWRCSTALHLLCLQRGTHGPALSRKRSGSARMAFITSASGPGYFALWPQSAGTAGVAGADQICRSLAHDAKLPLAQTYKAWLSTPSADAIDRFEHDGPWFRTDGVALATSKADLVDGVIGAPLQVTERAEPTNFSTPWTGTQRNGRLGSAHCTDWTAPSSPVGGNAAYGNFGHSITADGWWSYFDLGSAMQCSSTNAPLYCFADNDSLFVDGLEAP